MKSLLRVSTDPDSGGRRWRERPACSHNGTAPRSISSRLRRSSTPLERMALSSWDNHSPAMKLDGLAPCAIRTGCFCRFDPEPGFFSPSAARLPLLSERTDKQAYPRRGRKKVSKAVWHDALIQLKNPILLSRLASSPARPRGQGRNDVPQLFGLLAGPTPRDI